MPSSLCCSGMPSPFAWPTPVHFETSLLGLLYFALGLRLLTVWRTAAQNTFVISSDTCVLSCPPILMFLLSATHGMVTRLYWYSAVGSDGDAFHRQYVC